MGPFDPAYTFNHRVSAIVNESTVVLTTPDGREKRCNTHHIKPMSTSESSVSAFQHFQDGIDKDLIGIQQAHQYNLCARNN